MATWLKLSDGKFTTTLVDLDKVTQFAHNTRDEQILIYVGNSTTVVSQQASPVAYQKVLSYMRQLEQQMKTPRVEIGNRVSA
jgi:hypothetical protein